MRDRIHAAQLGEFVRAAIELRTTTGRTALKMHEIVSHAWAPGVDLPEIATRDTLRKITDVRKSLDQDEGRVVAPIALAYFQKIRGRQFTEFEAAQCLPRKSAPQIGLLFVDPDSSPRDLLVWQEWIRQEAATSSSRGSEAMSSVGNAVRLGVIPQLESQQLLLAIEAAPDAETGEAADSVNA